MGGGVQILVLNESKEAERILETGEFEDNIYSVLCLLAKYFNHKCGLSKSEMFSRLDKFMYDYYKGYNYALWGDSFEKIILNSSKHKLREIDSIAISNCELDKIKSLKNIKYQKLMFTLLCIAKMYNNFFSCNNGWVTTKKNELYEMANVRTKYAKDKFLYLNDLMNIGFISFAKKNTNLNIKVEIIDSESIDIAIIVTDLRNLGYQYMRYIGSGRFVNCERCGKIVMLKNKMDFSTKYCVSCRDKIKREQDSTNHKK